MRDSQGRDDHEIPREGANWTIIALVAAFVLLAGGLVYLATRGNSDQDKLTNRALATANPTRQKNDKLCASGATYDLIKRELFRRAAQLRGSDQSAFDRISAAAVVRMENPVMESEDAATGAVNCSGSLALDLPPGVEVVGGRRTLTSELDYTVTMAADNSGPVILLKNADAIITQLATLAQVSQPPAQVHPQGNETNVAASEGSAVAPQVAQPPPGSMSQAPAPQAPRPPAPRAPAPRPQQSSARPSFDCSQARTRGEMAVCNEAGLAALDRQMAAQYARAFAIASPEERQILRETAHRFYSYRDRCPTNACIGDAYTGRIREIRDIMEGRWQPPQ